MKLPENYGGSRFVQSNVESMPTKMHKPNVYKAVKTTHSPTFEETRREILTQSYDEPSNTENNSGDEKSIRYDNGEIVLNDASERQGATSDNSGTGSGENTGEIYENETTHSGFNTFPPFYNGTLNSQSYQSEDESYLESEFGKQEEQETSDEDAISKDENNEQNLQKNSAFSKLGELFGKIESDELLLLCIILLISSDGKGENSDILPILSLLLLNKK